MNKFIFNSLLILGSTFINPEIANSAIVNGSFNIDVETGSFAGTNLTGLFKYDDSSLTGSVGNGVGFFEFEFEWFGVIYREDDNPGFASRAEILNGELLGIQYFLGWDKPTPNFYIRDSSFSYEDSPGILDGKGSVSYKITPEPLTILGAGTAIAFGAGFKRKLAKARKK